MTGGWGSTSPVRKCVNATTTRPSHRLWMIPRTPAIEYLVGKFMVGLLDEHPNKAELPPRPGKVAKWELRAACAIIIDEMRAGFADLGSQTDCDPAMRLRIDAEVDAVLTRLESLLDRI